MVKAILSLSTAAALTVAVSAAQALPLPNLDDASSPHATLVYGGCGVYGHRGPYGGCRPGGQASGGWHGGYWRGGYWGGTYYAAGACPVGYHLGPHGRLCWPN